MKHFTLKLSLLAIAAAVSLSLGACNNNSNTALSGSKLTQANYDLVHDGMTKSQVQSILGAPTSSETKDMVIFKKTTYRYEDGKKFVMVTFKNDELDSKDGNLATP